MADHAWCHDVTRDAAVRAAEDGRDRPLPTLDKAIAQPFADYPRTCETAQLRADANHLLSLAHEQTRDFAEVLAVVGRINARVERLEGMMAGQENKGESMTRSDRQAADYRREASGRVAPEEPAGLRTERVTLEITRPAIPNHPAPAKFWMWEYVLRDIVKGDRESVRVVEEAVGSVDDRAYADRMACDEERDFANRILDERDAAIREREELRSEIGSVRNCWGVSRFANDVLKASVAELESQLESVACRAATAETELETRTSTAGEGLCGAPAASGGGELEPVAWGRRSKATGKLTYLTTEPPRCIWSHEDIVPLYAAPQPASVWLTEEERKAVEFLASLDGPPCVDAARKAARIGKELLARSSPPEVVLPPMVIAYDDMDMLKEALAAAGIKMKEVGRE